MILTLKYCGQCGETIQPGESYTEYPIHSDGAGGTTVYRHNWHCAEPTTDQTDRGSLRH